MSMCVAFGCNNRNVKEGDESDSASKITFHRFPVDLERRQKWTTAVKRDNFKPSKYSVICSIHFKETDFDNSSPFRRYLKKDAVPSIFSSFPKHLQPSTSKERRVLKRNLSSVSCTIPSETTETPSKITKTELEQTTEKLKSVELKLTATKKKLRNLTLKDKRSQLKIANLNNIISRLYKKR